jgi:drug/metabolite transporter (DMT)-like permease
MGILRTTPVYLWVAAAGLVLAGTLMAILHAGSPVSWGLLLMLLGLLLAAWAAAVHRRVRRYGPDPD